MFKRYFLLFFFGIHLIISCFFSSVVLAETTLGCCQKTEKNDPYTKTYVDSTEAECKAIPKNTNNLYSVIFTPNAYRTDTGCVKKALGTERNIGDPIYIKPTVSIPDSKYVAGQTVKVDESTATLANYIVAIFKYSTGVIGIIAAIVLMLAGIMWVTAAGNQEQIGSAKKMIGGGLMGLVLTLGAFVILSVINTNLVNLKVTPILKIETIGLDMVCALKTAQDGTITSQNISKTRCEKMIAEEVNSQGYKEIECKPFTDGGWSSENNTCVQTTGCCFLDIGTQIGLFEWPWGDDQICIQDLSEKLCKKNATSALSNYIPGVNFLMEDVDADHYRGQKCEAISDCSGNLICSSEQECKEKLKIKNQSDN